MSRTDFFEYREFKTINLNDPFFDSLKKDYTEFETWFKKKENEKAYIHENEIGVQAFLYLKIEEEELTDINPILPLLKRIKIGTLKINPKGTRFGERFIKKAIDLAVKNNINELYVTIFENHDTLIRLLSRYGFNKHGIKNTKNGEELVLLKRLSKNSYNHSNVRHNYPLINKNSNSYLLSIYPAFHSRLFPDSILNTENPYDVIKDVSYSNSIEKIYICRMKQAAEIKRNDNIVIYRTGEEGKPAEYSSVASSLCTVVEVKTKTDFNNVEEVLEYCLPYSIFTEDEIRSEFYRKSPMIIIRMLYNTAFKRRIIRKKLAEECQIDRNQYWGIIKLSEQQFSNILELGEVNESIIID